MSNICKINRKARKIRLIQDKLDTIPRARPYSGVNRISIDWIEGKLDGFIIFLNQDKKRLLDLEKSKFEYLEQLVNRQIESYRKKG